MIKCLTRSSGLRGRLKPPNSVGMRIIAGEKRGFGLVAPPGEATRPTLGRVRESVFGILGARIIDAYSVDLFAGAGTLGLEALSRGASHCTFVENSAPALKALRANLEKLQYTGASQVATADALAWAATAPLPAAYHILFADPPYHRDLADQTLQHLDRPLQIFSESVLILQYGKQDQITYKPKYWSLVRQEKYGETVVSFFSFNGPSHPV